MNFRFQSSKFKISVVSALGRLWLVLLLVGNVEGQAPITTKITDFQAPTTDNAGRRSLIKGANAEPAGVGILKITAPHVDNYQPDGALDMSIDAAECFFDYKGSRDVWSEKELSMKTADARLSLKGVGFRWQMSNSQLTVSNKVEAIIRRQALVSGAVSTNSADFIRVTSDSLEHQVDAVTFRGRVRVVDPQGEVRCRILKVKFDGKNPPHEIEALDDVILTQKDTEARGRRALYTPTSGLLRLFENTRWRMKDGEGESELLILDRTNNTLRAETKVRMTLPSSLLATNSASRAVASTNKVRISADTFDFAPTNSVTGGPIAIFNGPVHAVDPQATLDCELLTIFFDQTNRLVRAIADRNVQITRPDGSIKGTRAVFENNEITVPNEPTWRLKESVGSAELLVFNPRTREVRALKKVRMEMPSTGTNLVLLSSTTTNQPGVNTNILIVTATYFTNKGNVATFSENVRVLEPRGQIDANRISLHFNSTNRVDRVIAEGDVILTEQKSQAIGQRADYDVPTGLIRLTGAPKVMSENRQIVAREFIVDRPKNQFQPIAPFRIEIRNLKEK